LIFASPKALLAQSTQATFLGTVKDASGAAVTGAKVKITNVDEGVSHSFTTDSSGDYRAPDFKPGRYTIEITKDGFQTAVIEALQLVARQELRVDAALQVGAVNERVIVEDTSSGVINTENSSISATIDANAVTGMATTYRANGETTPLTLIQILPGVQPDSDTSANGLNAGYSIQGGLPSQAETSVDGISTQDVTGNNPLIDAFPSAESIAEVRVEGVGNNAEFGQPGEITTISKSGTNDFHGGVFWYHQNAAFDAVQFGSRSKQKKVANDFGATLGGPVFLPHLYDGHNKTFFYATYEALRFPQTSLVQNYVPSTPMRSGDFSQQVAAGLAGPLKNPFKPGTTYSGNALPSGSITSAAQQFLSLLPSPNVGNANVFNPSKGPNYVVNQDTSISSNQFDVRGDQYFGQKALLFGRLTWKNGNSVSPNDLLVPVNSNTVQSRLLATAFSYNFSPSLLNEFRFGYALVTFGQSNSFNGPSFASKVGLTGIGPNFPFNGIAELDFNTLTSLAADRIAQATKSRNFQFNDSLSWTKGRHTTKSGFDIRKIEAVTPLGFFGADNYGTFGFTGNFTGQEFADFLLGLPTTTNYDVVSQDNDGKTLHYGVFGQDTWQVTPRLTLTYGVRWEFHPAYHDPSGNIGNFDPSVPRSGLVTYPDGKASLLNPGFLANFNACPNLTGPGPTINGAPCTPVLSNSQAGVPYGLRTAPKYRFMPRFGFAYRPFNDDKTAVRGGFGMYNITTLGSSFYSLTGTIQSGTQTFNNIETSSGPTYQWPAINAGGTGYGPPQYGTDYFGTANQVHWKDPYSMQWNLSVDHQFWGGIGASVAYIGMKTDQLVWAPNYNDMSYSTTAATSRPLSDRPFPNWGTIQTRNNGAIAFYNALQFEARRQFRNGLTFNSTYTWAKNLADNQGPSNGSRFAGENGGARATYIYNRHLDYGNVIGSRRHRWITSVLYDLPVGRGRVIGSNRGRLEDSIFGGWELSNILLVQTGTYLTPYFRGGDPSGTGSGILYGRKQHPDTAGNPIPTVQNANDWINPLAFVCPGLAGWTPGHTCNIGTGTGALAPIGRFGNTGVGTVVGPGTVNLNTGLSKAFAFTERLKLKAGASFTNVLNHTNLADPNLNITSGSFGKISTSRTSDFGGPRTGLVFLRLDF
jgi:hypothetical protein